MSTIAPKTYKVQKENTGQHCAGRRSTMYKELNSILRVGQQKKDHIFGVKSLDVVFIIYQNGNMAFPMMLNTLLS